MGEHSCPPSRRICNRDLTGCRGRLRLPAEEALTAINRTALGRFKGNSGFPPTLRTDGCCLRPLRAGTCRSLSLGLARLAALGFIFEILVVEEVLLSRRKNKLCPAIRAFDDSIRKLWHHHHSRGPTQTALFRPLRTQIDLEIIPSRDDFSSCFSSGPAPA